MGFVSYSGYILSQLFYFCLQFALFPVTTFTFFWPVLISFFRFYSSCISNVAFPIAYTMLVIYGMVSALGNYRRRILFALSWISSDNFTFGSFSLGSIWSKVNGSGFPVLIKNIVQVLYPFLKVPHLYSLERSQLLQHPLPLALLYHYSQLAQQYCLLPQGCNFRYLDLFPSSQKDFMGPLFLGS